MLKKGLIFLSLIAFLLFCYFLTFSKVKQNQIKNFVLHKVGILSSEWKISTEKENDNFITTFSSPTLFVDDIYTSMQGPHTNERFKLNETEDELYWVTKFEGVANSKFNSNDFICHMNLFHSNVEHFSRLGFKERINLQDSRLITLTSGTLSLNFPKGFAYPIYSNEKMFISSQALNLYKKEDKFNVNFDLKLHYSKNKKKKLKPLYMKYLVLSLPYTDDMQKNENSLERLDIGAPFVECAAPSSDNRFEAENSNGDKFTAFWKVPPGEYTYINDVTSVLNLQKTQKVHFINAHVHPYATSLELKNNTTNKTVFKSIITNSDGKKGIESISSFSSIEGVALYPNHKYTLIQKVNNTSKIESDMMASMFVYFYDEALDLKLNKK